MVGSCIWRITCSVLSTSWSTFSPSGVSRLGLSLRSIASRAESDATTAGSDVDLPRTPSVGSTPRPHDDESHISSSRRSRTISVAGALRLRRSSRSRSRSHASSAKATEGQEGVGAVSRAGSEVGASVVPAAAISMGNFFIAMGKRSKSR